MYATAEVPGPGGEASAWCPAGGYTGAVPAQCARLRYTCRSTADAPCECCSAGPDSPATCEGGVVLLGPGGAVAWPADLASDRCCAADQGTLHGMGPDVQCAGLRRGW